MKKIEKAQAENVVGGVCGYVYVAVGNTCYRQYRCADKWSNYTVESYPALDGKPCGLTTES